MPLLCDAILFDLDGILVNSNPITERHWRSWAARHDVSFERIAEIHHGRPTVETVRLVAPHLDAEAEAHRKETAEADDTDGLTAFDGVARLLEGLPSGRWAIVTSGTRRTATTRLAHTGLPVPDVLVTSDDVTRGKPAPDPYLLAAEGLGVDPARCVVVEDAPAGVEAGRAAGARVVAVAATNKPASLAGADVVVAHLNDLEVEVDGASLCVTWREAIQTSA